MRYTLRQLQVFAAVARTESVSQAAQTLALSQSAVSGALGDLERQFDIQLFDRLGKRLRLNEVGRALQPEVESLIARAEDLEQRMSRDARSERLRVGATLTIGNYLGVHLAARFMQGDPPGRIELDIANTAAIARKVRSFEIDIGLVEGELSEPELEAIPWLWDELVVFCKADHPFGRKRRLSDADLLAASWIVREPGSGTRQAFERAMQGVLPELSVTLELQHTEAIKQAVSAGLGLGCLSRLTLEEEFARGTLKACRVPHRDFRRRFFFLLHRQKYRSAVLERWLTLCREYRG